MYSAQSQGRRAGSLYRSSLTFTECTLAQSVSVDNHYNISLLLIKLLLLKIRLLLLLLLLVLL